MRQSPSLQVTTILDRYAGPRLRTAAICLTGPTRERTRFIYPPTFAWVPVQGAYRYEVFVVHDEREVAWIPCDEPLVDLASWWNLIPMGHCRWVILATDRSSRVIAQSRTLSFWKRRGFTGKQPVAKYGYAQAAGSILAFLARIHGEGLHDETLPPYLWHRGLDRESGCVSDMAFPTYHFPLLIEAFLMAAASTNHPATKEGFTRRARELADWLIEHSTPADCLYPHLPYPAIGRGRLALRGDVAFEAQSESEEHIVEPAKAGHVGLAYLHLAVVTAETRYREAAQRLADTLCKTQLSEGCWPHRVNAQTGDVISDYTSTVVFAFLFFDELCQVMPQERYQEARQRSFDWLLANPTKTCRWENIFEDAAPGEPYANPGNYDALFFGRYLATAMNTKEEYRELAETLFRWIEEEFVFYEEDALLPYYPFVPCVAQQRHPFPGSPGFARAGAQAGWPTEMSTANWLLFCLALWQATSEEQHLHRAQAAGNVLTHCLLPDGRSASYIPDCLTGAFPEAEDIYGSMALSALALLRLSQPFSSST